MDYQDKIKKQGITYTKKKETDASICYECKLYDATWFEVWQKRKSKERVVKIAGKEIKYRAGAIYPRNEEFGRYAYTIIRECEIDQAMKMFSLHKSLKEEVL